MARYALREQSPAKYYGAGGLTQRVCYGNIGGSGAAAVVCGGNGGGVAAMVTTTATVVMTMAVGRTEKAGKGPGGTAAVMIMMVCGGDW